MNQAATNLVLAVTLVIVTALDVHVYLKLKRRVDAIEMEIRDGKETR